MNGAITNLTIWDDLQELIPLMIKNYVHKISGADHYDVAYQDRGKCPDGTKPLIYWNSLSFSSSGRMLSLDSYTTDVSFMLGMKVKSITPRDSNPSQRAVGFQLGTIVDMWNQQTIAQRPYSFTWQGVTFTNKVLADFGIYSPEAGQMVEIFDNECKAFIKEFTVQFQIHFPSGNKERVN